VAKLFIDGAVCDGHGRCYAHAPELLDYDDGGLVVPRDTDIDVPEDGDEVAREAAASCPAKAITYTP
jgi:ferredoxin